jgi:hypothetical protein
VRLPDFLVVGATKAGSTSIAQWLSAHPEVYVPQEKELHFFSDDANWARGTDWYARHFEGRDDVRLVGEATPQDMYFPLAIERMAEVVPAAKLIITLREPGSRAFSNWCHVYYRLVREHRPFPRIIAEEIEEGVRLPGRERASMDDSRYLSMGLYAEQLRNLYERFPRDRVHVMLMDEMAREPEAAFVGACRFLGLDPGAVPAEELTRRNPHREFRPVRLWRFIVRRRVLEPFPPRLGMFVANRLMLRTDVPPRRMDPATRARLDEFYAGPDAELAELLGRELPWRSSSSR